MGFLKGNINCFNNVGFDVLDLSCFGQILFRNMKGQAEKAISQFHRNKTTAGKEMEGEKAEIREMKDVTTRWETVMRLRGDGTVGFSEACQAETVI